MNYISKQSFAVRKYLLSEWNVLEQPYEPLAADGPESLLFVPSPKDSIASDVASNDESADEATSTIVSAPSEAVGPNQQGDVECSSPVVDPAIIDGGAARVERRLNPVMGEYVTNKEASKGISLGKVLFELPCLPGPTITSWWIGQCRQPCPQMRRMFQANFSVEALAMPSTHPHPEAASLRSAVSRAIDNFARQAGLDVYSVSASSRDEGDRERLYHSVRDYAQPFALDEIGPNHLLKFVDVDYYADLPRYLSYGRPTILYTFVPVAAAGQVPDGSYSIREDRVTVRVDGGACYEHGLWDFSTDFITVGGARGLWVYTVDQLSFAEDPSRRVVGLFPEVYIPWTAAWLCKRQPLQRRTLERDGVVRVDYREGSRDMVSLSLAGRATSVSLPLNLYEAIVVRHSSAKWKVISDVERYLSSSGIDSPSINAALLFEILNKGAGFERDVPVTGVAHVVRNADHYQAVGPLVTEDGREYARVVSPPLVLPGTGAAAPCNSYNNDVACIKGRVNDVRNTKTPPGIFNKWADEFVKLIVPVAGIGTPVTLDEVMDNQNRPTQIARSEQAFPTMHAVSGCDVKSFQKAEFYPKENFPRNISTVPTDHTLRLSRYTYGLKKQRLLECLWYLPCKTPPEIAEALVAFCLLHQSVDETDYGKFDGTLSEWLRINVEFAVYLRWVSREYYDELRELLFAELQAKGRTKFGVKYNPGCSRLSGSPLTTDGNTIINAFVAYCCGRMRGLVSHEAWREIGLCYGDDGVTCHPQAVVSKVAQLLGLDIKIIHHEKHDPVGLLGRLFPDPWTSNESVQDPARTIGKIHLSVTTDTVPREIAAVHRATGYLATDSLTPLLGNYCRAVRRVLSHVEPDARYAEQLRRDDRYVSVGGSWPQLSTAVTAKVVAERLGLSVSELNALCDKLDLAGSEAEFPAPCINLERATVLSVVSHGEVKHPPKKEPRGETGAPRGSAGRNRREDRREKKTGNRPSGNRISPSNAKTNKSKQGQTAQTKSPTFRQQNKTRPTQSQGDRRALKR